MDDIIVKRDNLRKYKLLGCGGEGDVYQYNRKTAIKLFEPFSHRERLPQKYQKIEKMTELEDPSFCFPKGFVRYEDGSLQGYYMDRVISDDEYQDFDDFRICIDRNRVFKTLDKAGKAIKRIHSKNVIIGDLRPFNILVDQNGNPIFVDTDNYAYDGYGFDIVGCEMGLYERLYRKKISRIDNDRFLYCLLCLMYFGLDYKIYSRRDIAYYQKMIAIMKADKEVKELIWEILSDSSNKPYFDDVLKMLDPNKELFSNEDLLILNR